MSDRPGDRPGGRSKDKATANDSETLTPTQERRLAALVDGLSRGEIARSEGVSVQAVSSSLAAPAVKRAQVMMRVGALRLPMFVHDNKGNEVKLVASLLASLATIALEATKPVVAGSVVSTVPDYELRAKIALRLLEMIEPEGAVDGATPPVDPVEVVARERITQTRTREIRSRS